MGRLGGGVGHPGGGWATKLFGGFLEGGSALQLLGELLGGRRADQLLASLLESGSRGGWHKVWGVERLGRGWAVNVLGALLAGVGALEALGEAVKGEECEYVACFTGGGTALELLSRTLEGGRAGRRSCLFCG